MKQNYFFRGAAAVAVIALMCATGVSADAAKKKNKKAAEPVKIQTNDKGYYKDVYMESGIGVTSRVDLPSVRYLGLEMEKILSAKDSKDYTYLDTLMQNEALVGSAMDENGVLLYPDGAPRFRVVYVNGGNAMRLSNGFGQPGRDAFLNFIHNGGSYVGTCAGAFYACHYKLMDKDDGTGMEVKDYSPEYIGIWPGVVRNTAYSDAYHGLKIEPGSPLLKYYDFGGDMYVDSVRHNGGCYGITDQLWPEKGEVLARYDLTKASKPSKRDFNDTPVIWSVKEKEEWGRVVSCGSHPEGVTSGDRLHLFCAMLKYAMDGNAPAKVKGALTMGEARIMDLQTKDAKPEFTRIGDKQYHHFTVEVPEGLDTLRISLNSLKGWKDYDMYLYVNPGDFAFRENARYQNLSLGFDKDIVIPAPAAGTYYISVFCATTVTAVESAYGTRYTGRTDVLNGVPYSIGVNLKPVEPKK